MFLLNRTKEIDTNRKIPYKKEIKKIHDYHQSIEGLSQEELQALSLNLRNGSDKEEDKQVQAYAIIHEVIKRTLGMTPYDVQIAGGITLREGNIAQMRTGEGKTITALFPAYWGYVDKKQTYVITVNDYLAERDSNQAKQVFDYLNIEVGFVSKDKDTYQKKEEYAKPIVYITNSEFAFDYLRDNISTDADAIMQQPFDFAIIDEADLVLIDEAKNPVIISGSSMDNIQYILGAKHFVGTITEDDYEVDEDFHIPILTEAGYDKGKAFFGQEITDDGALYNAINQAMLAEYKFKLDVDYIVRDGEVHIVDKYTGRVLPGRRFQNGLHQALEMKEGVAIKPENSLVASTTYQSLFRQFKRISGMTGTAIETKAEFRMIYNMDVLTIPTNKPIKRVDNMDVLFKTKKDKYAFLVDMVKEKHEKGQPILIGTTSVKESEDVSEALTNVKIPFHLLNAKNDKEEVEIVKRAGEKGMVTISTNMAGRGTDIKLTEEVEALGGLCVIGTSRNESKRIDRQLSGRSGRQGEVGESIYLSSLEDEFLLMYPSLKLKKFMKKTKEFPVTKEIASKMVDDIQETMESQSASIRKMQFEMDDILHYQREYVYGMRREILVNGLKPDAVLSRAKEVIDLVLAPYLAESTETDEWDMDSLKETLAEQFEISIPSLEKESTESLTVDTINSEILTALTTPINDIQTLVGESAFYKEIGRDILLQTIDKYWVMYLNEIELYKQGFGFTSMGEQDPIRKFSVDMDALFKELFNEALMDVYASFSQMTVEVEEVLSEDFDEENREDED